MALYIKISEVLYTPERTGRRRSGLESPIPRNDGRKPWFLHLTFLYATRNLLFFISREGKEYLK
jgi:hypothetical protein